MTIVFNGREDDVQRITVFFNAEGYAEDDYYDTREMRYKRKPEAEKKPTFIVISAGHKDKPDIYFEQYNARETIYSDLCYGWHLNDTSVTTYTAVDKLSIETNGGLLRIIWTRKEADSEEYVTIAEHSVNMKNVEYYWVRRRNIQK